MELRMDEAVAVLSRTPATLDAMLRGLPAAWLDGDAGPGTWSPAAVVAHLVYGERTDWLERARIILEHGEAKPFEPFDRAGHEPLLREHDADGLLDLFAERRRANLAELESMEIDGAKLGLRGTHPELGGVTLSQLVAAWAVHDLGHVAQIVRTMAKQYRGQVGAWEAYLPVLSR